jgi:hypothetical protein
MFETIVHQAIRVDWQGLPVLGCSCTESGSNGNFRCPYRTRLGKEACHMFGRPGARLGGTYDGSCGRMAQRRRTYLAPS